MPKTKTLSSKQSVPILTPAESRQVRACLDLLQEAQNICELAARQLCAVRGFANEWSRLSKPCDALKRAWHDVEARRQWLQAVEHKALAPAVSMPDDAPPATGKSRRRLGSRLQDEGEAPIVTELSADRDQAAGEEPWPGEPEAEQEHCPECGVPHSHGATSCHLCSWSL